jgi:hypothetical protein
VRELTEEEQVKNYLQSYTNAASEFSSEVSLYPHGFEKGDLKEGQQSIEEYSQKRYFKNLDGI